MLSNRKLYVIPLALLIGCSDRAIGPAPADPAAAPPAGTERPDVERGNGAAYHLLIHPLAGRVDLIPLAPPDWLSVFYTNFAVAPSGTGGNTVKLQTDQTQVTYTNGSGQCFSNGSQNGPGCAARVGPCLNNFVFCAPVQMTSNFTNPLPDVVLRVANRGTDTRNAITACGDSGGAFGQCAADGSCAGKVGNAAKVDCSTSALTSAIGSGATGCSYCYENASQIGSNDGLRDAVLLGVAPTAMSTDMLAMTLTNDNSFGVDIVVNYARPFLEASVTLDDLGTTPACATKGLTVITATGGGFGPPSGCTTSSCPASGSPATNYILDFVKSGGNPVVPAQSGSVTWADNTVSGSMATSATGGGSYGARVRTPFNPTGVLTGSSAFTLCNGSGPIDHFGISVQGNVRAGRDFTFSVVAFDDQGHRVTNYTGTITVSLSPEGTFNFAGAPDYTFVLADNGGHKFQDGGHVEASGAHTLSVTDNEMPTPHTGSVPFNVN